MYRDETIELMEPMLPAATRAIEDLIDWGTIPYQRENTLNSSKVISLKQNTN